MLDTGYHDLYNYLVNQQSYFTGKVLKAYKSLDAYKYFVAGWVSCVQLWKVSRTKATLYLIMSQVSDSLASPKRSLGARLSRLVYLSTALIL